jgi:hypothetical protein
LAANLMFEVAITKYRRRAMHLFNLLNAEDGYGRDLHDDARRP